MARKPRDRREPSGAAAKKLTIRVPAELYADLARLRERDGISLQGAGVVALREYVKKRTA